MRKQITMIYEAREIYSPFGTIEFLDVGEGTPVLISHGIMGGWDHGFMLADRILGLGYRLIIPSRFGYLKSSIPDQSDFETQADCFAYLLDNLGIQDVAVMGLSAGGVPAMSFALKYPERVTRLVLISTALHTKSAKEHPQKLPISAGFYQWILKSDFRFKAIWKLFPKKTMGLLGISKSNIAVTGPEERDFIKLYTKAFLPVSQRFQGWINDSKNLNMPSYLPIEQIQTPTLLISARDDTLAPHEWSRQVSTRIPSSRLISHSTGGHLILGHTKAHRATLHDFIDSGLDIAC